MLHSFTHYEFVTQIIHPGIMKTLIVAAILVCLGVVCVSGESSALPRSTPEDQGISSSAILAFIEAADRQAATTNAIHSFMLVRHGHVVAEGWWSPYGPDISHRLFSLSKSFTSTAVGLAMADGKLSLDDTVLSFFPEDAPTNVSTWLKAMRVRDLLIMSSGQNSNTVSRLGDELRHSAQSGEKVTRAFLAAPVECKPGTLFV